MSNAQTDTDLVRTYLKEIGRVPMLTQEQEVTYGKSVQALMKLEALKADLVEASPCEPTLDEWAQAAGITTEALGLAL